MKHQTHIPVKSEQPARTDTQGNYTGKIRKSYQ